MGVPTPQGETGVCPASSRKPYDERTRECSWDNGGCIGETHLGGVITKGANKGHQVETSSRLLNFVPNHSLRDIDGNMIIDGK